MHDVVVSDTGLWVAPGVITNGELVASYNTYTRCYNAQHTEAIATDELTALAGSSVEFIEKAPGIHQRYMIDKAGVLDPTRMRPRLTLYPDDALPLQAEIGVAAARDALTAIGRDAVEVDMLLYVMPNSQRPYPMLDVEVQNNINAGDYAFDMNVACSLTTFRLEQAINTVRNSMARAALVVSPEVTSDHPDWKGRGCRFIFGDMYTAVLVEHAGDTRSADTWYVLGTKCATSSSSNIRNNAGYLSRNGDRSPGDRDQLSRQEDRKVFKEVCPMAAEHIASHLQQLGHVPADVRRFWLHQANLAMNQPIGKRLLGHDTSADGAPVILDEFASTVSAGSIIMFHRHRTDLKSGDLGMIYSFDAGYSISSVAVQKQ